MNDEDVTLDNLADLVDRENGNVADEAVEAPAQPSPAQQPAKPETPGVAGESVATTDPATQTPPPSWSWDQTLPADDPNLPPELRGKPVRELLNDRDKAVKQAHYAGFEKNSLSEQVKVLRHAIEKFAPKPATPEPAPQDAYARRGVDPDLDIGGKTRQVLEATAEAAAERVQPSIQALEQKVQAFETDRMRVAGKQAWETALKEVQQTDPNVTEDWFKENTRLVANVIMSHRAELYQRDESGGLVRDGEGNPVIDWRHPESWKANPLDRRAWVNGTKTLLEAGRKLFPQPAATATVTAPAETPAPESQPAQPQLTSPPPTGITRPAALSTAQPSNSKLSIHERNAIKDIADGFGFTPDQLAALEGDIAQGR